MYTPEIAPLGSLLVSALVALLPLAVMFLTLGVLKWKAHWAGLTSLATALVVAVVAFKMPIGLALLSATQGAVFGLFPIMWIVLTAIWLYQVTVVSGRFEDLRAAFDLISRRPARRRRSSSRSASAACWRRWPASAPRSRSPA